MLRALVLAAIIVTSGSESAFAANDIGATGQIEPRDGVVQLNGVGGATILSINVHIDQTVKKGDLLMVLDDRDARSNLQFAEMNASHDEAAANQNIADHQLVLNRDQDHLDRAEKLLKTYQDLGPTAVSQRQIDDLAAGVRDAQTELTLEQSRDVQMRKDAAAAKASTANRLKLAKQQLADFKVVAPSDGTILKIDQHVGEHLNGGPAIEFGDLTAMYVVCRVFQGDLLKLKPGMKATVKGGALTHPLSGTVEQVGRLIDTKAQLADVRIKLDDQNLSARLVGMEVDVQITP